MSRPRRRVQAGSGPESTEEYGVTVAASLARHFLLRDRAVDVLTQGQALPVDLRNPRFPLLLISPACVNPSCFT